MLRGAVEIADAAPVDAVSAAGAAEAAAAKAAAADLLPDVDFLQFSRIDFDEEFQFLLQGC